MDVQALRCFVEVVRQQGFTRAGRTLRVTQPAISRTVKGLEDELGTPLLVRERRRVRLTEAGEIAFDRAQAILDSLRGLEEEVVELSSLRRGRLRFGMAPVVGVTYFPPLLAEFRRAHPGIALELREEGSHEIEALVRGHELDLGAVVLPTDEKTFGTLPFVREALRAVLHPSHPLARRRSLSLGELAGSAFVQYRPEFALHGLIRDACRRSGFEPKVVSESSHWEFMVAMVAADVGVALLPATICRRLSPREVRSIRLREPEIPWHAALVWRRDRHPPPATRAFLALAEKRLKIGRGAAAAVAPARAPR